MATKRELPYRHCETCGKSTLLLTVGCCGECAQDFNAPDPEFGLSRVNTRRRRVGWPVLFRDPERGLVEVGDA